MRGSEAFLKGPNDGCGLWKRTVFPCLSFTWWALAPPGEVPGLVEAVQLYALKIERTPSLAIENNAKTITKQQDSPTDTFLSPNFVVVRDLPKFQEMTSSER